MAIKNPYCRMSIYSHISFNPLMDRYKAEQFVRVYKAPVLRPSSIQGHYALTYANADGSIAHALLREAYDKKIECVNSHGAVFGRYDTIDAVLHIVAPTLFPRVDYGSLPHTDQRASDCPASAYCDAPPRPHGSIDP